MKRWNGTLTFILCMFAASNAVPRAAADEPAIGVYHHQLSPGPANSTYKEGTQFPKSAARFKALFAGKRP